MSPPTRAWQTTGPAAGGRCRAGAGAVFASLGGAAAGRALATNNHLTTAQIAALQQSFSRGFHITFIVCACIAAIGIFTSLVRGKENVQNG